MASISFPGSNHGLQVGDNSGSIHAEFHLPPERPETPPSPLSTVPFARDRDFISRDALLRQIRKKSSVPGSRIALVGLGGVGKSQLAIEYSYQIRSESAATWVFWVHASNEARFEQSFRDIADQLKIPGRQDTKANIFRLVENWLRDEKKGKWICILDNADDDQFLCLLPAAKKGALTKEPSNAPTKPLVEYIPRSCNGFTIITSRSREVALKTVKDTDLIQVNPMERSEALELLQKTLKQTGGGQESQQLVEELECMPLAIVQAASYIRERGSRYSVPQYLRDFRKSDSEAINLLKREAGHLDRDREAKNSIIMTWQISFNYLRREKPSAAELLSLMSFFDRQGIPEDLIRRQPSTSCTARTEMSNDSTDGETSESGSDGGPDFEDDVTTLRNYSFIFVDESGTSFTMHRLMQLTTRAWLKSYGEIEQWRERFIHNLSNEFPTGEYDNWERCRSLFPHVRAAMSQRPGAREPLLRWAGLLHRGAWYASESGNIADAKDMASKSHKERLDLLGAEAEEALASTAILAHAYSLEGRWDGAERLQLGGDHPDTLRSMANLASTYRSQGRWDEAEQLQVQAEQLEVHVMETRKIKLGADHPNTLASMGNLAFTWKYSGHNTRALGLLGDCLAKQRRILGPNHPDTVSNAQTLLEWKTEMLNL
ncbi:P-loop containing nucleoside triphosphate hydrolase protein [Aspergillus lucknowensis]|uniref:P-loop containing nucleoside triphosphate hydrolase protein n=1 Tax=Aspergillus lucknowensis TaxID=176173 RepID=A0ABR4L5G6_9EURO